MNQHWPVADLDPIRRLRVMAAATPGTDLDRDDHRRPAGAGVADRQQPSGRDAAAGPRLPLRHRHPRRPESAW